MSGPKRILVVGNAASPHIRSRATAVARRGHAVRLVSHADRQLPGIPVLTPNDFTPWPGPLRSLGTFRRIVRLYRLLCSQKADFCHVHFAFGEGAWTTLAAGKSPLILSAMGADVLFEERDATPWAARRLTVLLLRSAALITVKTNQMAERVAELGADRARIMRVVWGVDRGIFHPKDTSNLRAELGIKPETPVVLSPRNLTPAYNIDLVLKTFHHVRSQLPQALLILCDGNAVQDYKQSIHDLARKLGLENSIRFSGQIPHEQMPEYYSLADVVLSLAHKTEGMPQSLLEAMACGTPCVATRLKRYEEYVTHEKDVLLTPLNPDEAARLVLRILNNQDEAARLSEAGQATVAERADISLEAERVCQAMADLTPTPISPWVRIHAGALLVWYTLGDYYSNLKTRLTGHSCHDSHAKR